MFNFIVLSTDWKTGSASIPLDRLLTYTADHVNDKFRNGSEILVDKLGSLPCLFMQEGTGDGIVHAGKIYGTSITGNSISFDYSLFNDIPIITNNVIYSHRDELNIDKFEFSRNHWAVKDIDLFRVLINVTRQRRSRPIVFKIEERENIDNRLASAMMPFDISYNDVYSTIRDTTNSFGLRCERADNFWQNHAIIQDIVTLIDRSWIVICDCTGKNPNVFYEIGIAHTLGREVIIITQNEQDIPFDLRHLRYIRYLNNAEGRSRLSEQLAARIRTIQNSSS